MQSNLSDVALNCELTVHFGYIMSLEMFCSADCILERYIHLCLPPPVILTTPCGISCISYPQICNSSLSCFKIHCVQAQFIKWPRTACTFTLTNFQVIKNNCVFASKHLRRLFSDSRSDLRGAHQKHLFDNCLPRPIRELIILLNVLLKLCSAHFLMTTLCSCTS